MAIMGNQQSIPQVEMAVTYPDGTTNVYSLFLQDMTIDYDGPRGLGGAFSRASQHMTLRGEVFKQTRHPKGQWNAEGGWQKGWDEGRRALLGRITREIALAFGTQILDDTWGDIPAEVTVGKVLEKIRQEVADGTKEDRP
jgi:hypothetical protein